jgi:RimJ/RimL family protein N-acetyltransferase
MFYELVRDDIYRLETPKLWLRWPRLADAPNLARFLADHEVTKMTSRIPHPYPPEEAERFIFETRRDNVDGQSVGLVVTPNAKPDQAIGAITLGLTQTEGELVIGYWIAVPFWGRGYAKEAVQGMIEIAFSMSSASRIVASVRTTNPASKRVLERNGFTYTHDSEPFMPARGGSFPVHWFELDRVEWRARQRAAEGVGHRQSAEYAVT